MSVSTCWSIRPLTASDYEDAAALYSGVAAAPMTADDFVNAAERRTKAGPYIELALLDGAGAVRGFGLLWQEAFRQKGALNFTVAVDPAFQGQGGGRTLYAAVERQALALGAHALDTNVRDDRPAWRAVAEGYGYTQAEHFFRSVLDLQAWDEAAHRPALEQALAAGYRFISLADAGVTEANKRRLYELDMDCARDEPGFTDSPEWPPISYEEYEQAMVQGARFDPAGVMIAVAPDGEWAALSGCFFPPEKPSADVFFTCVRRAHRGHGLAQAAKLLATAYAKVRGCQQVYTTNHERNPAMLAINRKFGFVPLPGSFVMRKPLAAGPETGAE